jgi:hypothetical protein
VSAAGRSSQDGGSVSESSIVVTSTTNSTVVSLPPCDGRNRNGRERAVDVWSSTDVNSARGIMRAGHSSLP